jgi:hypothetical protein
MQLAWPRYWNWLEHDHSGIGVRVRFFELSSTDVNNDVYIRGRR